MTKFATVISVALNIVANYWEKNKQTKKVPAHKVNHSSRETISSLSCLDLKYVYEVDSDFSDLLGGNFSSKSNAGSRTLKDMRAESDINNALDPDRAKVDACTYTCTLIFFMCT